MRKMVKESLPRAMNHPNMTPELGESSQQIRPTLSTILRRASTSTETIEFVSTVYRWIERVSVRTNIDTKKATRAELIRDDIELILSK